MHIFKCIYSRRMNDELILKFHISVKYFFLISHKIKEASSRFSYLRTPVPICSVSLWLKFPGLIQTAVWLTSALTPSTPLPHAADRFNQAKIMPYAPLWRHVQGGETYITASVPRDINEDKPHSLKNDEDEWTFPLKTRWTLMDLPRISYQDI